MRLIIVTCFAFLAGTAAASAAPAALGSFIISSFLSAGAGALLPAVSAAAIGNFVIGAAAKSAAVLRYGK